MFNRAVADEAEEEEVGEVVGGEILEIAGERTIESASKRFQNTTKNSKDTTIPC